METRRYISLAIWSKERHEHLRDENTNVVPLTRLIEAAEEPELISQGQASHIATSTGEAA